MKQNRRGWVPLIICLIFLLVSGCGFITTSVEKATEENKSEDTDTNQSESEKKEKIQPVEVKFSDIWTRMPWKSEGGIWLFTKEDHPGNANDLVYSWDEYDVLLIQSGDKKHYGYELKVVSVQLLDAETAKIVVYLNRTNKVGTEDAEPARVFIRVDRGVLQFKKFIVETEDGNKLFTK